MEIVRWVLVVQKNWKVYVIDLYIVLLQVVKLSGDFLEKDFLDLDLLGEIRNNEEEIEKKIGKV